MNTYHSLAENLKLEAEKHRIEQAKQNFDLVCRLVDIHDLKGTALLLESINDEWNRDSLRNWLRSEGLLKPLTMMEVKFIKKILPAKPKHYGNPDFTFIDLFAGIGGIRKGFEDIGGECIFTSEWDKYAVKTYKANWYCDDENHIFNTDIRDVTLSNKEKYGEVAELQAIEHIRNAIPRKVNVLLAGFPCQPFSLAGVSKKNALGRAHGFECKTQGTLFFDVEMIIKAKRPEAFVLENVKNLKSHDGGKTFAIITETLDRLGYWVADIDAPKGNDPKIVDGALFTPQHRERIILVGFRKDLNVHEGFTLKAINQFVPKNRPSFKSILHSEDEISEGVNISKYQLTPKLWEYLYNYAIKHAAKGNGFGYGLIDPEDKNVVARTLSARYHKDGSEILVNHMGWNLQQAEDDFWNKQNQNKRPRRLTPRECARLMGFDKPGCSEWKIPVSDTQAYRQFGNSVVVPVFSSLAKMMYPKIMEAVSKS
ncbi:DNA (cytosine-5-)-methyltransferase [Methylophaga sp. SB9B]|uniref:DNA (cytosine-5-)-methyltransferase n=1 Tax=Methylophaga sp. SB9B TaxID=2570356 RepID=UPI0010A8C259|nr:DNA (cytosine-5-)-methyltransferase [Methylophaga sp. SB9B]THK40721.1 DNA (cytosine-5-)-methyltransferase [Methylophaga sp. SB9B]